MSIVMARNYGRFGNVAFQVAVAACYSLKHNLDLNVQWWTNDGYWNPNYFGHLKNDAWVKGVEDVLLNENGFRYQEIPFEESWRGKQIVLNGYYQSWMYLEPYRSELLYILDVPYEKKEGYVSCHVRRGDYLRLRDKHPEVTDQWYNEQMAKFPGYKFKFYSDDIAYCRSVWGLRRDCEFSAFSTEMEDIAEASSCEHNICSASTFSFWISWLNRNPDKQCIFPKLWFTEGYHLDTTDLLHPSWIKA
jgi:hypothetical protein